MANILPTLRGSTKQGLYPYTRSVKFNTSVMMYADASEQRQVGQPPLQTIELPMSTLSTTDKASWLSFFSTQKGRFNQDLQITLNSVVYNNLTLESDVLSAINPQAQLFNQAVKLRQVSNAGWTPPTPGTTFPTLSFGASCEQPFTQMSVFNTGVSDSQYGERFSYAYWAAGVSGFPSTYLRAWKLEYPLVSDADIATLESFFLSQFGKWVSFSFKDPLDSITYTHVRFDMDVMEIRAITKNQWATSLVLRQTNGS